MLQTINLDTEPRPIDYESLFMVVTQNIIAITGVADLSGKTANASYDLTDLLDSIEDILYCDNEELEQEVGKLKRKTLMLFNDYEKIRKRNHYRIIAQGCGKTKAINNNKQQAKSLQAFSAKAEAKWSKNL